jgi:UDP-glucose 4-epimerase
MALYNSFGSLGWLDDLPADIRSSVEVLPGDVRDIATVRQLAKGSEVIYHLAALIAIPYSYVAPRSYVETNIVGTLNVLEAVRELDVQRMVHTSTSETYGTPDSVPIAETHALKGQSPYAASKIGADKLAESYFLSYATPVTTLRPFNTFGPRQSARAVIPTVISQVAAGAPVVRLGALEPTRDFNYVKDMTRAFVAVGAAPAEAVVGQLFNAGSGNEVSVGDMVRLVGKVMDREIEVEVDEQRLRPEASEVLRLVCDSRKLGAATGWAPASTLEDGLRATAEWFIEPQNLARYRTNTYNI